MNSQSGSLNALVQERIDKDADFQTSIASMSDEDKVKAIAAKREEIAEAEFKSMNESSRKHKELADNYKTRAEKAEKKSDDNPQPKDELSGKDYALLYSQVHADDVDEVVRLAKAYGLNIEDALKHDTVKTVLEKRVNLRKTANATNTQPARPSNKTVTDQELLEEASKGKVPEKGTPEAEQLFWAKRGGKRK